MNKLICLRGYSGSGKSTWAREWLSRDKSNRVVTSRDDLRSTLFDGEGILPKTCEDMITKVQKTIVVEGLNAGKDVVVDNTHLPVKFLKDWADLAADLNVEFEVRDFKVSMEECAVRDQVRIQKGQRGVGWSVINRQAERFPIKNWKTVTARPKDPLLDITPYEPEEGLPFVVIVDIDGTIADFGDARGPFEWDKVGGDLPREEIIKIVRVLSTKYNIVFFSGRDSVCYDETWNWLERNILIPKMPELYMRPIGDNRKDSIIKLELFNKHIRGKYNVAAVVDDRLQVVKMWFRLGLPVFRVGDPDATF